MRILFLIISVLILSGNISAQTFEVSGKICDAKTNKPLEFVTVKIADTSYGTTADQDGKYFIRLKPGGTKLIFSYIGYNTDTSDVYVEDKNIERNIFLKPAELMTQTIEVYGEDPAYEIIRKAIKYKKEFKKALKEYEYDAYSKFVIRSNRSDVMKGDIEKDSSGNAKLGIYGILESQTKGYFKAPDIEKQVVTAKKETANIIRGTAIPLVVNFYDEKIDFGEFKIPTPLSDGAFGDYDYKLIGTTSIDSLRIFKIRVMASTENRPLLDGIIYIADSLFSLMQVDLTTNDAAKPLGINKIVFKQKFSQYHDIKNSGNLFWMPTDVEIFANGSFAGLIKFDADVFTIVSDYQLNKKAPEGTFDDYVIKVMPNAEKDSAYWSKNQLIKNTKEENTAYKKIEIEDKKKDKFLSLGLTSINYGKRWSSNPLNYYHFNPVEGSALMLDVNYRGKLNRVAADGFISYGTSDKKTKYQVNYTQRLLNDRRLTINAGFYRKLQVLSYPDLLGISEFVNTIDCLFSKKNNFDYNYTTGYNLGIRYNFFPQFGIGLTFTQDKQWTAYNNSNYSFVKSGQSYSLNPPINDAFQRVVGVNVRIDPNSFQAIDWGDGDISRFKDTFFPVIQLGFKYSGKDVLNSTYLYRKYSVMIAGRNYINSLLNFQYRLGLEQASGQVPFQSLLFFRANSGTIDQAFGFTAINYQEFLGDKIFYLNFQNNFGKLVWGGIPVLKNFNLIGLFNMGRISITDANYELASYKNFYTTHGIYMEAGFGISRILDVFRIDFAWRLNNLNDKGNKVYTNFIMDLF